MPLKLSLRLMLELLELDVGPPDDIDSFHETFHSFPHVAHWFPDLLAHRGCQRHFILVQDLDHFCIASRVHIELQLSELLLIRVCLAQR